MNCGAAPALGRRILARGRRPRAAAAPPENRHENSHHHHARRDVADAREGHEENVRHPHRSGRRDAGATATLRAFLEDMQVRPRLGVKREEYPSSNVTAIATRTRLKRVDNKRIRRLLIVACFLLAATPAFGEDEPEWNSIIVRFTIDPDGRLHVSEQAQVDVPPNVQRLERTYWNDSEQEVTFDAITLYDGDRTIPLIDSGDLDHAHRWRQQLWPGRAAWSVRDKTETPSGWRSLTYVIESHVSDTVIPAWSIPRGKVSHDTSGGLTDPRKRLREVIPIWREALKNPKHRFLLDYLYDMPPPSTKGTQIQLQIYWPAGWNPVHEITPDTVARPIKRDFSNPDQYRVTHLFEEDGRHLLTSVYTPRHAIRMAALVGFPIVGLLFWIMFVLREVFRRPRGVDDGEQLLREVVYNEAPEVVEARWSGVRSRRLAARAAAGHREHDEEERRRAVVLEADVVRDFHHRHLFLFPGSRAHGTRTGHRRGRADLQLDAVQHLAGVALPLRDPQFAEQSSVAAPSARDHDPRRDHDSFHGRSAADVFRQRGLQRRDARPVQGDPRQQRDARRQPPRPRAQLAAQSTHQRHAAPPPRRAAVAPRARPAARSREIELGRQTSAGVC